MNLKILIPIFSLLFNTHLLAQSVAEQRAACEEQPSKRWDNKRNMCVTTQESKATRDRFRECEKLEGAARKACTDSLAENESGVSSGQGEDGDSILMMNLAIGGIMGATAFLDGGVCTSKWILIGTSVVALAGDFFYKKDAEESLEELQEKYKAEQADANAFNAQKRSFEYLRDEQLAIKELAEKRANMYYLMAAGYGAAAAYGVYEAITTPACAGGAEGGEEAVGEAGGEAGAEAGAEAGTEAGTEVASGAGTDAATNEAATAGKDSLGADGVSFPGLGATLQSPIVVVAVGGLAAGLSLKLGFAAADQAEQSEEQAKQIEEVMNKFLADASQFCPEGREDLRDPQCFCFLPGGERNPDRSNSNTCQKLFAELDRNLFRKGTDYNNRPGGGVKGCFFLNRKFDPKCRCKSQKQGNGDNTCLKASSALANLDTNFGQAFGTPSIAKNSQGILSGNTSLGNLDGAALRNQAIKNNGLRKKEVEKINKKLPKKERVPSDNALLSKIATSKEFKAAQKKAKSDPIRKFASTRPSSVKVPEEVKKKILPDGEGDVKYKGQSNIQRKVAKMKKKRGWGFSGAAEKQFGDIQKYMDKKYDFKENDINSDESASIFKIITNRYNQTGYDRLFPDEVE